MINDIGDMIRAVEERVGDIDIDQYELDYDDLMEAVARTIVKFENSFKYGDEFPDYDEKEFWEFFELFEKSEEQECPRCSNGCNHCLMVER